MTTRYRHRTTEVEAVQWTGTNADVLRAFAGADFDEIELDDRVDDPDETAAVREADHGTWRGLKPGDWVVRLEGGLYEFSAADFASQYEAISSAVAQSAPADRAVVRTPNAEALLLHFAAEAHRRKWSYDRGLDDYGAPVKSEAFDVLHRLGEEMRVALEKLRSLAAEERAEREAQAHLDQLADDLPAVPAVDQVSTCSCGRTPDPGICPFEHDGYKAGGHCTCAHPPVGRDESHRLAERQIRDAARGLFFDVGARVIAVLDDDARRLAIRAWQGDSGSVELPDPKFKENAESLNSPAAPAVVGQAAHGTRSAVLREAADFYDRLLADMGADTAKDPRYWTGVQHVATGLRRMADEERTP